MCKHIRRWARDEADRTLRNSKATVEKLALGFYKVSFLTQAIGDTRYNMTVKVNAVGKRLAKRNGFNKIKNLLVDKVLDNIESSSDDQKEEIRRTIH